jgi:hypothetical protein
MIVTTAIFIRHKMDTTPDILEELWRKRLIVLHYTDSESVDPADYRDYGGEKPLLMGTSHFRA